MIDCDHHLPKDVDAIWLDAGRRYFVQFRRTNTVRDVRDALLGLSYLIRLDSPDSVGVTVLVATKLSHGRLGDELDQFHQVIKEDLAERWHCVVVNADGSMRSILHKGGAWSLPSQFLLWLRSTLNDRYSNNRPPPLSASLSTIVTLAQMSIEDDLPATLKSIQDLSGVSYPTVVAPGHLFCLYGAAFVGL